jgi:endonuclease I
MKNLFMWCVGGLLFGLLNSLTAQDDWNAVTLSDTVVSFGMVNAEETHSMELTITNNQSKPVQIISAVFEEDIFSTNLTPVEIAGYAQYSFNVYFNSKHNVNYTDFLRIELDQGMHPLIAEVSAQAVYSNSYYDAAQNKWGAELKSALHNTIKGHTEKSYSSLWDVLSDTDENPDNTNNVILLYTGWSKSKNDHGGDPGDWNREHVWAKSHGDFDNDPPAGTDAHHIRPSDVQTNSGRGNKDFDNGGTQHDRATGCYYDSDSWEARDAVKGDVARMMYYMVVRYEGEEGYDLELVDYTPSTVANDPLFGKQSTLYQWHQGDQVDDWERQRNDRIYTNWQGNRNPFIDYPQFAERMPGISGGDPITAAPEIAAAPVEVDLGKIGFNYTACYYIAVINTGGANLNVSSISSTNADFQVDKTSMNLSSESYEYVKVSFTSAETEDIYTTNILIESNDDDESLIEIPVTVEVSSMVSIIKENRPAFCYHLYPNYPNPFNSQTTISFSLASAGAVKLAVYNINGQLVQVILDNILMSGGAHKAIFDANSLPSGIYYYRLTAGKQSQSQKLVFLK